MVTEHLQAVGDCLGIYFVSSKSLLKGFKELKKKKIIHLDFISVAK